VGCAAVVVEAGATRVAGGVEGAVRGTTEVVGAAWGVADVGEASNEGAV
jgi:hypothetical protein